ncbi:MAG: hypothetical protein ACJ8BF_14565, partial [Gemmatimonadales bacterium]
MAGKRVVREAAEAAADRRVGQAVAAGVVAAAQVVPEVAVGKVGAVVRRVAAAVAVAVQAVRAAEVA